MPTLSDRARCLLVMQMEDCMHRLRVWLLVTEILAMAAAARSPRVLATGRGPARPRQPVRKAEFYAYLICSLFDLALDVELLLQVVDLLVERGQGLGFISGQETRRVDLSIWKIKNNSQDGYFSQEPRTEIKLFDNFVLELITTIFHLMEAKQRFDLTCRTIRVRRNIEITARLVWDTQIPL